MPEQEKPVATSRGMPIVTTETIKAIFDVYTNGGENWGQRLMEVKERLIREQPELAKFLEGQVSKYPNEMIKPVLETTMAMYTVLEQQTSSDQLSNSFSVIPEEK